MGAAQINKSTRAVVVIKNKLMGTFYLGGVHKLNDTLMGGGQKFYNTTTAEKEGG